MQQKQNRDIFIIGGTILTLTFVMPVIDCFGNFVMSILNKQINKWQLEGEIERANVQEQQSVRAIGFDTGEVQQEEYYE